MNLSKTAQDALVEVYGNVPSLPIPFADRKVVRRAVAGRLFGTCFSDEQSLEDFLEDQENYKRSNRINRVLVEVTGIGPSLLTVTSCLHLDIEARCSTMVLEFDRAQSIARAVETEALASKGEAGTSKLHRPALYALWTRSLIEGELIYGFVHAAGPYMWDVLDTALTEWVDERYPGEGPWSGSRPSENLHDHKNLWLQVYMAGTKIMAKMHEQKLDRIFEQEGPWVFHERTNDFETRDRIVFSNASAMERVRLGSYYEDIANLPDGSAEFATIMARVTAEFLAEVENEAKLIEAKASI